MKEIKTTAWELVLYTLIIGGLGVFLGNSCNRPAHADGWVPSFGASANRIACALEGIQHLLEKEYQVKR